MTAADLAAEMLAQPGRRVVVVAESPTAEGEIDFADVVAVHADTVAMTATEAAADDAPDLAWFATQARYPG